MSYTKDLLSFEERLPQPPDDAFSDAHTREVDDQWLGNAREEDQVAAIAQWFSARFWDPANETPYMSSEGGYIWVHGGPYDAREEIEQRFGGLVAEDVIEDAIDLVQSDGNYEWAPTYLTYYDASYDVDVDDRNQPTKHIEIRLNQLKAVLALQGNEDIKEVARNLAYGGVVAALETFLWETMTYWVDHDKATVERLITTHPTFRDRQVKLGDIYKIPTTLRNEVKAFMQNLVWHRADQVSLLFKYGLGINLGFRDFDDAIKNRHHIVHRSGQDLDGLPLAINDADVSELADRVLSFANEVDSKIAQAVASPPVDAEMV